MDIKKFGIVILIIGAIIFGIGAIRLATNQQKQFVEKASKSTLLDHIEDMGNLLESFDENEKREENRKKATNLMIIGGIVMVIGGGVSFSAKKQS